MATERLRTRAKLARWGGYFCLVFAVFWTAGPGTRIWRQFRANHGWPLASAVVKGFSQHSRKDLVKKNNFYVPVYWMEFTVLLDLPLEQCPPPMRTTFRGAAGCFGTYNTTWTDSAPENWQWGSRHPVLSTVQVHYDPTGKSGSAVFFAGEAWANSYSIGDIARGFFILFLAFLCSLASRSAAAKAEMGESGLPGERKRTATATPPPNTFSLAASVAMIPFSGSPPAAGNPAYYVEDMLGTSRVITTNSGVVC